jgi:putative membrane protein
MLSQIKTKLTMKRIMLNAAIFAGAIFFAASCSDRRTENSDNQDSEEVAKDENDAKFDDTDMEGDTKFAVKAADAGMLEVKLGELAQSKGVSQQVKDFGKMLVDEHSKANEELKALAATKNISLPATLSDDCQKKYDKLAEKSGTEFDEAFAEHMVKDHKDDIDAFKKQAEDGDDPDLKAWAAGKIPTLEHHLDMAKSTEEAVDGKKGSTGKLDR